MANIINQEEEAIKVRHVTDLIHPRCHVSVAINQFTVICSGAYACLQIAGQAKRVAVLGIAPESRADRAAHYVAKSLQDDGVQIVPVPVYYFDAKASLHTESDQATSKYLNMHGQGACTFA